MIRLLISEPSILLKSKLNEYINEVIEEKSDFNYCVFDFEETPLEEIIDSLQSPAFGSDKKVVLCKNPYFFKDSKIKLPFTNDLTELEKYLKDPNPDSDLIIVCDKKYYTSRSKYITLITKNGGVVENLLFEDEADFRNYGLALLSKTNINISLEAKEILFNRCSGDVCKLEREIAKLSLYDDKIDKDIICKLVARPLDDDVFELSNALLQKDHKRIMKIYTDLKLLKIEPINLIALLANQFRIILQVSILRKKGNSEANIATLLGIHPYRVKMAIKHLQYYNVQDVKNILIDLATMDAKIKTGEFDRYIDFELFLATK